jgi:PIN domain nuclease of toxin-antitoxin system
MNLLLDTEAFIFWTTRPEQLPARAHDAIRSGENVVYLSLVSPWEMQIKFTLSKLQLRQPPVPLVQTELNSGSFTLLPITLDHIDALSRLPDHHRASHPREPDDRHRRRDHRQIRRASALGTIISHSPPRASRGVRPERLSRG